MHRKSLITTNLTSVTLRLRFTLDFQDTKDFYVISYNEYILKDASLRLSSDF